MMDLFITFEYFVYVFSLFAGFRLNSSLKIKLDKRYERTKKYLYFLIAVIFLFVFFVMALSAAATSWLWYVVIGNVIFALYFFKYMFSQTNCWRQHRMIVYNFLAIAMIYFCSIVLGVRWLNFFVLVIYVYNILEFQFAKFDWKSPLVWD